jgi:deoxyribonuclease-4
VKKVGLHIRLDSSILDAADKASRLHTPFFQCFFVSPKTGQAINFTEYEIKTFTRLYRNAFESIYLHGSYWINLAGLHNDGLRAFKRELMLAKKFGFTHMVLHAGSSRGAKDKIESIEQLARQLNAITKKEHKIKLIIENTAHGKHAVCSDVLDFRLLLERLDQPDKIGFSLDTAHAFVYGYDLAKQEGQDDFIKLVDNSIGLHRVKLIHLNDSAQPCGSRQDKHEMLGRGLIGAKMLQRFISHPQLATKPIILELPVVSEDKELMALDMVRFWD